MYRNAGASSVVDEHKRKYTATGLPQAEENSAAETYRRTGQERELSRTHKKNRADAHDKGEQRRKSVAPEDIPQRADKIIRERRRPTTGEPSSEPPEVPKPTVYTTAREHPRHKLRVRWDQC
ncbi:hypothetical protein Trydic_g12157 [Trypoxylus dichotomus]